MEQEKLPQTLVAGMITCHLFPGRLRVGRKNAGDIMDCAGREENNCCAIIWQRTWRGAT